MPLVEEEAADVAAALVEADVASAVVAAFVVVAAGDLSATLLVHPATLEALSSWRLTAGGRHTLRVVLVGLYAAVSTDASRRLRPILPTALSPGSLLSKGRRRSRSREEDGLGQHVGCNVCDVYQRL